MLILFLARNAEYHVLMPLVRLLTKLDKTRMNEIASHPMQRWEWGEFRQKTGVEVERIGVFEGTELIRSLQVFFHPIPQLPYTIGYFPKSDVIDDQTISLLRELAKKHSCLFIKLEPNISEPVGKLQEVNRIREFLLHNGCELGKPLFTKFSFLLDVSKSEEDLLAMMHQKTRYNIRLAEKKGVRIREESSENGLAQYLSILHETTQRQGFFAHSSSYFQTLWEELKDSGLIKIYLAEYENKTLVSWIVFQHNNVMYYPYGASRSVSRDVMASNLMMWEMIRVAKRDGCTLFDMWGSLGPNPHPKDPWFGFHKFKEGYGGVLHEFVGSYDLVFYPRLYKIFRKLDELRWTILRFQAGLQSFFKIKK
ncbi:MAG: FemAB family protein [Microgenomates group bacterium GW2011_GWF2_45_18]|nr:MAG: FemAB family protein [Microgenomates group bacterium GW2011_GWF1_44_10]KKU02021.1 MAG: FemAB family protein [Microgenomates group bacterium GW2011_GWF2_45_18]